MVGDVLRIRRGRLHQRQHAQLQRRDRQRAGGALVTPTTGRSAARQFSMRNTRIGLAFQSPQIGNLRPSALIEGDFFGNQPSPPTGVSESTFYNSPTFRIRHAYLKLDGGVVDLLAGQTYDVFGWQNYFFPCSAEFLGLPNQVFSRNTQLRLSRTFGADGPISVDIAVSAGRPAQRDSQVPDFEGWPALQPQRLEGDHHARQRADGRRAPLDRGLGDRAPVQGGRLRAAADAEVEQRLRLGPVNRRAHPHHPGRRRQRSRQPADAHRIVRHRDRHRRPADHRRRRAVPDALQTPRSNRRRRCTPPDIDNGLVTFDVQTGILHTINWRAFKVGLQYYLPPLNGRLIFAANYTHSHSNNMEQLFPMGGAEIELRGRSPTPRTTPTPTSSSTRRRRSASASPVSTHRSTTSPGPTAPPDSRTTSAAWVRRSTSFSCLAHGVSRDVRRRCILRRDA